MGIAQLTWLRRFLWGDHFVSSRQECYPGPAVHHHFAVTVGGQQADGAGCEGGGSAEQRRAALQHFALASDMGLGRHSRKNPDLCFAEGLGVFHRDYPIGVRGNWRTGHDAQGRPVLEEGTRSVPGRDRASDWQPLAGVKLTPDGEAIHRRDIRSRYVHGGSRGVGQHPGGRRHSRHGLGGQGLERVDNSLPGLFGSNHFDVIQ